MSVKSTATRPTRRLALQSLGVLAAAATLTDARAGEPGAFLVVIHKVADFAKWKVGFDTTAQFKRGFGWKGSSIFSIDGDRNNVLVMEEFGSLERAKAFAASPELREAMGKAGVIGPPDIRFLQSLAKAKA